ncbi:MAG: VOC family protein [Puniceicoccales bacterium]
MPAHSGISALKVFLPAKDIAVSAQFYQTLGFELIWEIDDLKEFRAGQTTFVVQNFYQKEWAENTVMQLWVDDLQEWWRHIESVQLTEAFGVRTRKPQLYPWGLTEIQLTDPAGVLWHIIQSIPDRERVENAVRLANELN